MYHLGQECEDLRAHGHRERHRRGLFLVPSDSACLFSRSQPTHPTEREQSKRGLIDVDGVRRRNVERFLEPANLQHQVVLAVCLLRKRMPNQLVVIGLLV